MESTVELWKIGVDLGQFLLTALIAFFVWLTKQSQVNRESIVDLATAIDTRLDRVEARLGTAEGRLAHSCNADEHSDVTQRISVLEATVRHLPTHDDFKRVHERVDDVAGLASEVSGRLVSIERQLGMIAEHLINRP